MSDLDPQQMTALREQLQTLQNELQNQLQRSKTSTEAVQLDQTLVGRVSRMDAMQQQGVALSTQNKARARLLKVNAALAAMAEEEYGYCARCDEFIGLGRLQAQPEAKLCIGCQDQADQQ